MDPGFRIRKWIDFKTILCLEMKLFIQMLKIHLRWCRLLRKCTQLGQVVLGLLLGVVPRGPRHCICKQIYCVRNTSQLNRSANPYLFSHWDHHDLFIPLDANGQLYVFVCKISVWWSCMFLCFRWWTVYDLMFVQEACAWHLAYCPIFCSVTRPSSVGHKVAMSTMV